MRRVYDRDFVLLIGAQGSGKTYQLRRAVVWYARQHRVSSVFVCDRVGEFSGLEGDVSIVRDGDDWDDVEQLFRLPRVVVFQHGLDGAAYDYVFHEAILEGDCVLVLDEAWEYAPQGARWVGSEHLQQIVLAGRHLANARGELRPTHLIVATQYPRTVYHLIHGQANTVLCSRVEGEATQQWMRANFAEDRVALANAAQDREWVALRGTLPRWVRQG